MHLSTRLLHWETYIRDKANLYAANGANVCIIPPNNSLQNVSQSLVSLDLFPEERGLRYATIGQVSSSDTSISSLLTVMNREKDRMSGRP